MTTAVDLATGKTFDWSQVSHATWRSWYANAVWTAEVLAWQFNPPPVQNPEKVSALAWVFGGLMVAAVVILAVAGLVARDDDGYDDGYDDGNFLLR